MLRVRSPQDLGAAIVFVTIGLAGLYLGKNLTFGTASQMGPGFFPTWLSFLIIAIGVGVGVKAAVAVAVVFAVGVGVNVAVAVGVGV